MNQQPTDDELNRAWTDAIYAQDIPGAYSQAIQELRALRDKRTTWVGEELKLRAALDAFLAHA